MKRGASLFLLTCLFIYQFGYYGMYVAFQYHLESEWAQTVYDKEFADKHLLEIPMRIPYLIDNDDFHPTNISFQLDGVSYRGIYKRFVDEALQLVYVPDHAQVKLDYSLKQWALKLIPENTQDSEKPVTLAKSMGYDYLAPNSLQMLPTYPALFSFEVGFFETQYVSYIGDISTPPPNGLV